MKTIYRISLVLVIALTTACGGNSDLDFVKNGTMNGYETTTIGNAFDASFDSPAWEEFKAEKGERVVQFTGNISQALRDTAAKSFMADFGGDPYMFGVSAHRIVDRQTYEMIYGEAQAETAHLDQNDPKTDAELYRTIHKIYFNDYFWKVGESAQVQWIITPDGTSFNITQISSDAWQGFKGDFVLQSIYE